MSMIRTKTIVLRKVKDGQKFYINDVKHMRLDIRGISTGNIQVQAFNYDTQKVSWIKADTEVKVWEVVDNE